MADEAKVWISSVQGDHTIGNKLGLAAKFYGHEWEPLQHIIPPRPSISLELLRCYKSGERLDRSDFVEAAYAWSPKHFARTRDLFMVGPFYAVKGKLAEVMKDMDLGPDGLLPVTIYDEDKATPLPGPFYILRLGVRKDVFVPERSNPKKIDRIYTDKKSGRDQYAANFGIEKGRHRRQVRRFKRARPVGVA